MTNAVAVDAQLPDAPPAPVARRPVRRPPTTASGVIVWMALTVFLLASWATLYALVLSGLQEAHAQNNAYEQFREQLAKQTAPLGGAIAADAPVALIDAPTLGLHDVVVVEGTASDDLERGPGHKRDTPLPGQAGVSVIYGRATMFGAPFDHITRAKSGDSIRVTTGQGTFRYRVEAVRHVGEPFQAALAAGGARLTFATAEGASYGNLWTPQRPVYVDAKLVGKAQPSPGLGASAVTGSEKAMGINLGGLVPLVLWLPTLIFAGVAIVWAATRWGRWQAWLAGTPVLVAALWGVTQTAVELLPNLM